MRTGGIVKSPPHKVREKDMDKWLECFPTIEECWELELIPLEDRTYCETIRRYTQSPRLVRLSVAKKVGLV